jgi:prophage antirepressor-like protein
MLRAKKGGDLTPAVFIYSDTQQMRTLVVEDQPWFVAKDLCGILGISNHKAAITALDDDERRGSVIPTPSGRQKMQLVSESGLYNLIFRSRKAEAKAFRRWVTSEVLPSIWRTGAYVASPAPPPAQRIPRTTGRPKLLGPNARPEHLDVRHLPYDRVQFKGTPVRTIIIQGRAWYSLSDVMLAINVRTGGCDVARKLPTNNRHQLWLFGTTTPTWFVDDTGLKMLLVSRGHLTSQLTLTLT